MKRSSLTRIEAARTDPNAIAGLAVQRYLSAYSPGDFRYVATLDEHSASIQIVTIADVQSFHKQFYGASDAEAALVGNFDVSTVTQELTELFGAWKSGTAYERALDVYKPTIGKSQTFAIPDKANAIYIAGSNLNLRDDDPDYPALMVGNEILGGGFLSSRLATRIRQKDGLSYTVASQLTAGSLDPVGSFSIYAICAPQNAAKVESDVQEEITRAIADGFTASEIAGAKSGILQSLSVARSNDAALARDLMNHLFRARDFNWDVRLEKSIESVSPESVRKAVQRFIVPAQWVTVKAGDFSKLEN
jgi:zinc protease